MNEADFKAMLEQWGRWSKSNAPPRLGYGQVALTPSKSGSTPMITDKEAQHINEALALLYKADMRSHDAIVLYYVCGYTDIRCGQHMGMAKSTFQANKRNGVRYLLTKYTNTL